MTRVKLALALYHALKVKPSRVYRVAALLIGAVVEAYTHKRGIPESTVDRIIDSMIELLDVVVTSRQSDDE